jgi:hypothetical protein
VGSRNVEDLAIYDLTIENLSVALNDALEADSHLGARLTGSLTGEVELHTIAVVVVVGNCQSQREP